MTAPTLLDPEGDLPAPPGVEVIESEVDFLRCAVAGQSLLIRGARLCQWAQDFYALRGHPVTIIESPRSALRRLFPALSSEQAKELADKIGREHLSSGELSSVFVLNACFPADGTLWQSNPSPQHAARWLLWLLEHIPSESEAIILRKFADEMQNRAGNAPFAEAYRTHHAAQAQTLLFHWLGAEKKGQPNWGEFPLELPSSVLKQVKEDWMKRIIAANGNFFAEMFSFPLPLALRQELARLTAEYYRQNAYHLTHAALQQLHPYLDPQSRSALEEALPPELPSPLPEEEIAVLEWFAHQYLPYRRWQATFGDATARQIAVGRAQTFARWLLERYPRWLMDGDFLAFQKSARLADPNTLTLCIILDGLPVWDAEWLMQELAIRAPRLTLLEKAYCFTALPTVTEFSKEALLKGLPPRHASQTPPLGNILPDNRSPHKHLGEARAGQVWFWRVEQPDKAYHFEHEDKRERQIRAELQSIVEEIGKIANAIPDSLPLTILLTSDHGRLMNPRSPRKLPITAEIQAHGRAAWGDIRRDFPESGFEIDEKTGLVELYGERFGMTQNLRLAWGEACFASNGGSEAYPHGGLFPEEVIVPWFAFQRDAIAPELDITLSGSGEADMSGEGMVAILNHSPLALICQEIAFSHGVTLRGRWNLPPLRETSFNISLTPWPPKSAEGKVTALFLFSRPDGATFTQSAAAPFKINVLYSQPDDLFKDLDS